MNRVSKEDIKRMNDLYLELHTYAAVAREVGFTAGTVKKYIIPDYQKIDESKIERFNEEIPDIDFTPFLCKNWEAMGLLTNEEKAQMPKLWEELAI